MVHNERTSVVQLEIPPPVDQQRARRKGDFRPRHPEATTSEIKPREDRGNWSL